MQIVKGSHPPGAEGLPPGRALPASVCFALSPDRPRRKSGTTYTTFSRSGRTRLDRTMISGTTYATYYRRIGVAAYVWGGAQRMGRIA